MISPDRTVALQGKRVRGLRAFLREYWQPGVAGGRGIIFISGVSTDTLWSFS